jgi:signal transduction histidine kinase
MGRTQSQTKLKLTQVADPDSLDELQTSEIISLVAHELKNPIASIRGYAELLLSGAVGELNENQARFMGTILANVRRMTDLVGDLNDSARIDSGRERLNIQPQHSRTLVEETIELLRPQLAEKNLKLIDNLPIDLPQIQVDQAKFRQIILNLLSNAAKYTPDGGQIAISCQVAKAKIQFAVQDSGIGIKEEDQKHIFQRYYRTEDVHERDIPGTGLGLYICKRLIEMQNGEIWFVSEFEKGTTFYFTMPIE